MPGLDVATARLVPVAGSSGWVVHLDHAVAFVTGTDAASVAELVEVCAGSTSSAEVLGRVVGRLSTTPAKEWPGFALVTSSGADVVILVHGDAKVEVERAEGADLHLSADDARMWFTRAVSGARRVRLGRSGDDHAAGVADLVSGVLPADGAVLEPRSAAQMLAEHEDEDLLEVPAFVVPSPAEEPEPSGPAAVGPVGAPAAVGPVGVPAAGASPAGAGLAASMAPTMMVAAEKMAGETRTANPDKVTVTGRYCGRGHFNAPNDRWCRVCAQALAQDPGGETEGERPPLGALAWDSGETDVITRDTVVGRDPGGDASVASGSTAALSPSGQSEGMSRVHAELRLIGWEVLLSDRGSTNGTFVWDEGRQAWHRLEPGERCPLHVGTIVAFGERTATFESAAG
ncbi:MAG TPA: FHA domain-containing protein [Acidimicrobiales bacterium]|nr:FHA domain-containing protein [Acidimicrobiales bacterium]